MTGPPNDPPNGLPESLPDTAVPKEPARRGPVLLAAGLGAVLISLLLVNLVRVWGFSPGQELNGGGVENIVVSAEESPYLPPDVERFGRRPGVVYVYVVVRRMPAGGPLRVRVERESVSSVLSSIFSGGEGEVSLEQLETRPGSGENLDVVRFVLRERSGGEVFPGIYTIRVYREPDRGGEIRPVARKFFEIRG